MWAVTLVFVVRAFFAAWYLTPLWDVPDETGHFAYVLDIVEGRGVPIAGESVIPPEVMRSWKGTRSPEPNWISQHPPLYHFAAAAFLGAARGASAPLDIQVRVTRLAAVLLGAMTLILLFELLLMYADDALFAFSMASALSVLPMFVHMSAGVNHDVATALCGVVAGRYFVRLLRSYEASDLIKMSIALAAAGAIKLTALALAAPLLALALIAMIAERRLRWWHAAAAVLIAFATPLGWLLRTRLTSGGALLLAEPARAAAMSPLEYFVRYPVIDHTVKNFVGLIGWTGLGGGEVRWLQIGGAAYLPYLALLLIVSIATATWFASRGVRSARVAAVLSAIVGGGFFVAATLVEPTATNMIKNAAYGAMIAVLPFAMMIFSWRRLGIEERIAAASVAIVAGFALAYAIRIWNAYRFMGEMRATHGRYFFVVLPFLIFAFLVPAYRVVAERSPSAARFAAMMFLLIAIAADVHFQVTAVLPFFGWR